MYKRLICILLTISLFVGCFAFSASAVESDHAGGWVSLFDFNPNRARTFVMNSDLPYETIFSLPSTRVFHVDALVYYAGPGDLTMYVGNNVGSSIPYKLETLYLGNSLYRFVGNVSRGGWSEVECRLWLTGAPANSTQYLTWYDFKVCTVSREYFNDSVSFTGLGGAPFSSGGLVSAPSSTYDFYPIAGGSPFNLELIIPSPQRFDYYDLGFSFSNIAIDSVSAECNGQFFDISSSFSSSGDTSNIWYGNVSLDFDNHWLVGTGQLKVHISGTCYPYSSFQLLKAVGSIDVPATDPELSWLQKIYNQITLSASNIGKSIVSSLTAFFDDFTFDFDFGFDLGISEVIDSISGVIDSVGNFISTGVTTIRQSITSTVTSITDAISGVISSFGNFISTAVTNIRQTITSTVTSITDAISGVIGSFGSIITSAINSITGSITGLFDNLGDWLSSGFNSIIHEISTFFLHLFDFDYSPPEIDSSVVDRVDGIEGGFRDDVVGGLGSNDIVSDQADIILLKYSGALLAVTGIISKLIDHSFFTNILYFALSLGITVLIFNVIVSLDKPSNGNKKSGKFEKPKKNAKKR